MRIYSEYKGHKYTVTGARDKIDTTIYAFDIETTSYYLLNDIQYSTSEYLKLSKTDQEKCDFRCTMYIWMFSVNDTVYYGRTWDEFLFFLARLDENDPKIKKIVYIHNLAFEFQFLKSVIEFDKVIARKSRKPFKAILKDYNIELRCSYMLSNCALADLTDIYELPIAKKVGDLDYTKIRHSDTPLTEQELSYCEYDCLVLYEYIKRELETYIYLKDIPLTSTGKVRRELKEKISKNFEYKRLVKKASNINPHVYNLLIEAFMGGYTHANASYTGSIIDNVNSYDFTSSYPYVMVSEKYPSTEFRRCKLEKIEDMDTKLAYLIVVKLENIKCKYSNNFISLSKCRDVVSPIVDNGRIASAKSLIMTVTDIDFKFYMKTYKVEKYTILETYYSIYNYLPKLYINFILDKYVKKTEYKNVEDKKREYQIEKGKFNSLYGMCVTNNIKDEVSFSNGEWCETPITNEKILELLLQEKKKAFLSFSWGVWCTAYARDNLLSNVIKLDDEAIYMDTDSIKVTSEAKINVIDDYNTDVIEKIKNVSQNLDIPLYKFSPKDKFGVPHMLGVFDHDASYKKFKTLGAKKYAYIETNKKGEDEIGITVAGVPKKAKKALKDLKFFRPDYVFNYEDTGKMLLAYIDIQTPIELTDYLGNKKIVTDKTGVCLLPTTYVLSISNEYADYISDLSTKRAIYIEEEQK